MHSTCKCFGVSGSLDVRDSYPVLVNTEAETDNVVRACSRVLGADKVSAKDLPVLASGTYPAASRACRAAARLRPSMLQHRNTHTHMA